MTHVIFLVHGMGVYGAVEDGAYKPNKDWFDEAEKTLKEVYEKFVRKHHNSGQTQDMLGQDLDFDRHFTIEHITFDGWFENYRHNWEKQVESWSVFNFSSDLSELVKQTLGSNSAKSFFWTHVVDVLLLKVELVKEAVQQTVANQIYMALEKHHKKAQLESWSVIAHSLGTAVIQGAMVKMAKDLESDPSLKGMGSPSVICMAANVARAVESAAIAYTPTLAPGGPRTWSYLNCRHKLDPFCQFLPFDPPSGSPWRSNSVYPLIVSDYYLTEEVIDFAKDPTDLEKFAEIVPHGFRHYMLQPEVVATLWPLLRGRFPFEFPGLKEDVRKANIPLTKDPIRQQLKLKLEPIVADITAELEGLKTQVETKLQGALPPGLPPALTADPVVFVKAVMSLVPRL